MLPLPWTHEFTIDGDRYCLTECTRGGHRRIMADFALAIAPAPGVMDTLDGRNLLAEAVARECLTEAPDFFWETRPPGAAQNGLPKRAVTFEQVPYRLWTQFRQEVEAFRARLFPDEGAEPARPADPGQSNPVAVAAPAPVSPVLRGVAQ